MSYIPALSWSGAIRLTTLTNETRWKEKARQQMHPFISGKTPTLAEPYELPSLAGHLALFDLGEAAAARAAADVILSTDPAEAVRFGRGWTDDMFMATSLLARVATGTSFENAFDDVIGLNLVDAEREFRDRHRFWSRWGPFLTTSTALWIEERVPSLQYALVTALEPGSERVAPLLAREVERNRWESEILPRTLTRAVIPPLAALAVAIAMLLALPRGVVARVRTPSAGDSIERALSRTSTASRLSPLVARVIPPAYTTLTATVVDEPHTIEALVGSRIELEGRGSGEGIVATVGNATTPATSRGSRWQLAVTMPAPAAALRLRDREFDRLIVLDARADSAPVVTMLAPTRDTILRTPTGRIAVRGEARDALGLASTWLEYIVSSGQGESFRFRSGILARDTHGGARSALIATALTTSAWARSAPTTPPVASYASVMIGAISDASSRADSSSRSKLPFTTTVLPFSPRWPYCLNASGKTMICAPCSAASAARAISAVLSDSMVWAKRMLASVYSWAG